MLHMARAILCEDYRCLFLSSAQRPDHSPSASLKASLPEQPQMMRLHFIDPLCTWQDLHVQFSILGLQFLAQMTMVCCLEDIIPLSVCSWSQCDLGGPNPTISLQRHISKGSHS